MLAKRFTCAVVLLMAAGIAATAAATPVGGPPVTQPSTRPTFPPTIYEVKSVEGANSAGLGDEIVVKGENIKAWFDELNERSAKADHKEQPRTPQDLVLVINGIRLSGIHPTVMLHELAAPEDQDRGIAWLTTLHFTLTKTEATKQAWNDLLNRPQFKRRVTVTVGLEDPTIEPLPTYVRREETDSANWFNLVVIRTGWPLVLGIGTIVLALALFWVLANRTSLLRDTTTELRPDGYYPLSLARSQMAFWSFLVVGSYFLLWSITGDQDTITSSVLTLIGISAGTALGAAVVDAGRDSSKEKGFRPQITRTKRAEIIEELESQKVTQEADQKAAQEELNAALLTPADDQTIATKRRKLEAKTAAVSRIKEYIEFYRLQKPMRVVYDLLGDDGVISFHRFQIAVWTIVLGIVFVTQVYNDLSMPTFSATLLGLMGISAGTYIGFKLPATRQTT